MDRITQEKLEEILFLHDKWLRSKSDGVRADLSYKLCQSLDFRNANLLGANMQFSDFSNANLLKANFKYADLRGSDLRNTNLRRSYFVCANLSGADLRCADLRQASFSDANLYKADLRESDLCDAYLQRANLSYADLREAKMHNAYLSETNLRGAKIEDSEWPLWCGSFDVRIGKDIACQLMYHVLRAMKSVDDEEVKAVCELPENIALANKSNLAEDYGKV